MIILLCKEILFFYNEIAIYLLFGFIVAGILYVIFPESLVRRHLGKGTFSSVIKATAIGIPLPLCSCGVIPVASSLRRSGASKGATISFLISTPQIGADSFLITYSLLGWVFALFRITAALLTSVLVGIAVNLTGAKEDNTVESGGVVPLPEEKMGERFKNLPTQVVFNILGPIANPLLIGLLAAGLISALVPDWIFGRYFSNHWISMLVMLLIGIPMYVCASASTPIAASLVFKGLSPGSALVFLLTGPATNAVTIAAVAKSLGRRVAVIYLAGIAGVSLCLGAILDYTAVNYALTNMAHHHSEMLPAWLKLSGSVAILSMLILYYVRMKIEGKTKISDKAEMMGTKTVLDVKGMTCQHCVSNVRKAVAQVSGATDIRVDLESGKVEFSLDDKGKIEKVKEAIRNAGYDV